MGTNPTWLLDEDAVGVSDFRTLRNSDTVRWMSILRVVTGIALALIFDVLVQLFQDLVRDFLLVMECCSACCDIY